MKRPLTPTEIIDTTSDPNDGLTTLDTIVEWTGINYRTIQSWVNRGDIASATLDGRLYVRRSEVIAFEHHTRTRTSGRHRSDRLAANHKNGLESQVTAV